jgi:hypothetical protein
MADATTTFIIALIAYLAGIVTETLRPYFSDMLTDRRRDHEVKSKEKEQFRDVVDQMQNLINEIKKDLSDRSKSSLESFFSPRKLTLSMSKTLASSITKMIILGSKAKFMFWKTSAMSSISLQGTHQCIG